MYKNQKSVSYILLNKYFAIQLYFMQTKMTSSAKIYMECITSASAMRMAKLWCSKSDFTISTSGACLVCHDSNNLQKIDHRSCHK
jgi:hypothetical protein